MRSPPTAVMAVAALLLLLVSLAAAVANTTDRELHHRVLAEFKAGHGKKMSEKETWRVFAEWKAKHGRKYSSAREEDRRYAIFKEKLRDADLHKAAFGPDAVFGINMFSDRTDEEWRTLSQGHEPYIPREGRDPHMLPIYICDDGTHSRTRICVR
ncbi:oryzain alpha chain-like [Triticum dicoccoides]|uniref:oryzain alpha chain-like n=1 Tax=Triticum dicoccoides TaxID=85692 RepID=UPI0018904763|nr:oryzain alpha chain-like [Triticum dicoccoides]XP_044344867.1 oryzain alpha chain-like [Triticum aestivum]